MDPKYREEFYHNRDTREEALFIKARKLTKSTPGVGITMMIIAIALAVLSSFLLSDDEFLEFVLIMYCVSSLLLIIGLIIIYRYIIGIHCLEKAELLYNTRIAAENAEEIAYILKNERK